MRLFFTPVARESAGAAGVAAVPAPWAARTATASRRRPSRELAAQTTPVPAPAASLLTHGWAGDAQQMRAAGATHWRQRASIPVLLDLPAHGAGDGARATLPQWVRALFTASATLGPWHGVVAQFAGRVGGRARAGSRAVGRARLALVALTPPPPALFSAPVRGRAWPNDSLAERMGACDRAARRGAAPRRGAVSRADWLGPAGDAVPRNARRHDADDRTAPLTTGRALADALPHARLQVTQGLEQRGRILEDAAVVDAVVRHLGER